jgi:hypothetical protein
MKSRVPKSLKMAFEFDFKLKKYRKQNNEYSIPTIRPLQISFDNIVPWSNGKGSAFRAETLCVQRGTGFESRRELQS